MTLHASVLHAVAQQLGLPREQTLGAAPCSLALPEGQVDVHLIEDESMLQLACALGRLAQDGFEGLLLGALNTNLEMAEAGRPCLALDARDNTLVLTQTIDLRVEPSRIAEAIRAFGKASVQWRCELASRLAFAVPQ